ncbi:hypothetical protein [Xanthomonas phage XacN1]|nr:hypothetical protein [Xanthomonas phage XacN1]
METLKEIAYQNELSRIERGINFLESELQELLTYSVRLDEYANDAETMLNNILNDAERRIEAARRGLSAASKLKDPAERKQHVGRMLAHLNRTRSLLDKVVKEFFPEKVDPKDDSAKPVDREEYISPQQAAETLGIPTHKIQQLAMQNKLRMYNHNGKWALKGSEVQKLADAGLGGGTAPKGAPSPNRADFMQYVK